MTPGNRADPSPQCVRRLWKPPTSRSQSSGEGASSWGSLALSSSCMSSARGSCCVVKGCCRAGGRPGWTLAPTFQHAAPFRAPPDLQEFLCCRPLLGVLGQCQFKEVVEVLGPGGQESPGPASGQLSPEGGPPISATTSAKMGSLGHPAGWEGCAAPAACLERGSQRGRRLTSAACLAAWGAGSCSWT